MSVILGVAVPYASAVILIFLIWRRIRIKHPYLSLAAILLSTFTLWHLFNALIIKWQTALPQGTEEWLAVSILYTIGIQFLLGNYTCIEGETPSMMLFTLISDAGKRGCSREEIVIGLEKLGHIEYRLDTMLCRGLIRKNADGSLSATRLGNFIRRMFDMWFGILGERRITDD